MVRSPRMIPPMPSVSPIVWRRPKRFGTSKSTTVARFVASDLDHVDRVVGSVECDAPVGGRGDLRRCVEGVGNPARDELRRGSRSVVDVEEGDLAARELVVAEDVAQQVACERRCFLRR